LIGDVLRTAAYLPSLQKAGARRTYEVTLLWLPPRPEDSIPGLISGPPKRACIISKGVLRYPGVVRSPGANPQATPNPASKQTSHKPQVSEAIPRNERLNCPETAPAEALEQGPEHTQEDAQEEGAAGTGPRKSGGARGPKQRN
jgi:hypothetical protein